MFFLSKKDSSVHLIYMGKEKKNRGTQTCSIWCSIISFVILTPNKESLQVLSVHEEISLYDDMAKVYLSRCLQVPRPHMHAEQSHTQLHELECWSALWLLKGGWTAGNTCAFWTARVKKTLQGFCSNILYSLLGHIWEVLDTVQARNLF